MAATATEKACPQHGPMKAHDSPWGRKWVCAAPGCSVECWGGPTSTPADKRTRTLRHACHQAFDHRFGPGRRWPSRNAAYRWLAGFMGLAREETHIGMFDAGQCERLLAELRRAQS